MRALFIAGLVVSSICFAQGERPKKQSFIPTPEPALERPKSKAPAPSLTLPVTWSVWFVRSNAMTTIKAFALVRTMTFVDRPSRANRPTKE